MDSCPVCSAVEGTNYMLKEMMFGTRKQFRFRECSDCSTLYWVEQENSAKNEGEYCAEQYYTFKDIPKTSNAIQSFTRYKRAQWILWRSSRIGHLLNTVKPLHPPPWIASASFRGYRDRILDVGCGGGGLLSYLVSLGFRNLVGVDPNIPEGISNSTSRLVKGTIHDIDGEFDFVMFHHSLEHVSAPSEVLLKAKTLLAENGRLIIRIPVKDSFAWEKYGSNWVQLDAPRHRVIFTRNSFQQLCGRLGLEVILTFDDSTEFQFWGSEQFLRGIALLDTRSYNGTSKESIFSLEEIGEFKSKAAELNKEGRGDQTVFILSKGT